MSDVAQNKTILIGFAESLSAPEVVWSLRDAGHRVFALSRAGSKPSMRMCRGVRMEEIRAPEANVESSLADLKKACERMQPDGAIALDDVALWMFERARDSFGLSLGPLSRKCVAAALDKRIQLREATAAGFRTMPTEIVETVEQAHDLNDFPLILKPALAARELEGKLSRGPVFICSDRSERIRAIREWNGSEPMLAQPFIPGSGEGVFGFAGPEHTTAISGHKRIRMMNPAGSGSSACQSILPDARVVECSKSMARNLGWRGMFMIELLRDEDGRLWFMEWNGRAWGSLALARRQGLEYPAWTARQQFEPDYMPEAPSARPGLVCRHLGREINHLLFVLRGPKSNALRLWPGRWETLRDLLKPGTHGWYNCRRGERRLFWFDAFQTVANQVRKRKSRR